MPWVGVATDVILADPTSTVPEPCGTKLMLVFEPPDVNVNAPVPVMDPVLVPVPPFATGRISVTPVVKGNPVALVNVID